jgi:type VI secretion system protein
MSSRTLLDRLEYPSPPGSRELPGDIDGVMDSVREHLQVMLNTRHGCSMTVPDFGTTDFSDVTKGPHSVHRIREDILRSIVKYEPRLTEVEVDFVPPEEDDLTLHFDIKARVVTKDQSGSAVFHSVVETSGEVKVTR